MLSKLARNLDVGSILDAFTNREDDSALDLTIGVPYSETPETIKSAGCQAIRKGYTTYTSPAGLPELRVKLQFHLEAKHGVVLDNAEQTIVTGGATPALALAYLCLLDPGDEVIIPDPYFPPLKTLCSIARAVPRFVDCYPDFKLKASAVEAQVTPKTKVLVVNSPNNPTGAVYDSSELCAIADVARRHSLFVISDEVYADFVYDGRHFSIGSVYPNTLTVGSFSKAYAMSGWRIGYGAGPITLVEAMAYLQMNLLVCPPSIAQHAALRALDLDTDGTVAQHGKLRDILVRGLSPRYQICGAEGAFYAFLEAPGSAGDDFVRKARARGIRLLPGREFSNRDTHFRVSYAAAPNVISRAVDGLLVLGDSGH